MADATITSRAFEPMTAIGTEHENTVTAANLSDSDGTEQRLVIDADTLRVGDTFEIYGMTYVLDNNGTDTLTELWRIEDAAGTPNVTSLWAPAAYDAADADFSVLHGYLTCTATGTSGTFRFVGVGQGTHAGSAVLTPLQNVTGTIDTTTEINIHVNEDWSVAHADNEMYLAQLMGRKVAF